MRSLVRVRLCYPYDIGPLASAIAGNSFFKIVTEEVPEPKKQKTKKQKQRKLLVIRVNSRRSRWTIGA